MKYLAFIMTIILSPFWSPSSFAMDPKGIITHTIPTAIFHAFDLTYEEIMILLPELKARGYSHIQLMPSQISRQSVPYTDLAKTYQCLVKEYETACPLNLLRPSETSRSWTRVFTNIGLRSLHKKPWYLYYQPVSYKISSGAKEIIGEALKHDLGVIIDAVLAHVRAPDQYEKKDWVAADQQCRNQHDCSRINAMYKDLLPYLSRLLGHELPETTNPLEYIYPWQRGHYIGGWPSSSLPALRQDNEEIVAIRNSFFEELVELGVSGIRFDVANSLIPEIFLDAYRMNPKFYLYGEVIRSNMDEIIKWRTEHHNINVTSYHLFNPLKEAFKYGGDIRSLQNVYDLLNRNPTDVTFTATHDSIVGGLDNFFKMGDAQTSSKEVTIDSILAQAFLLSIDIGVPLILPAYHNLADIRLGLIFRSKMLKEPCTFMDFPSHEATVLIIKRGDKGLVLINKSGENISAPASLSLDKYRCLTPFHGYIAPRSVTYFVKEDIST